MQSLNKLEKKQIIQMLKSYDWNRVFNFIHKTMGQMTDRTSRMHMSLIRDKIVSSVSKYLQYKDEKGKDLSFFVSDDLKTNIECKYSTEGYLFVPSKKDKNGNPVEKESSNIILINKMSDEKNEDFEKIFSDYSPLILCMEPHCISIVSTKDLLENNLIKSTKGQIVAKDIPKKFFSIISNRDTDKLFPMDFCAETEVTEFNRCLIEKYNKEYDEKKDKVLTNHSRIGNNNSTEGENDMPVKDNSTKKAQEFIKKHKLPNVTAKKLQELFFKEGITKNYKCCTNYLERLVKINFLTKNKDENGQNVYEVLEISSQKKFEFSEENTNTQEISNKKIAYSEENNMHSDTYSRATLAVTSEYGLSAISKEVALGDLLLKISNCSEITRATKCKLMNDLLSHTGEPAVQPNVN